MKLRILSDLHLEFGDMMLGPGGDILVLAGDIGLVDRPNYLGAIEEWSSMFEYVIYVPGNHEFYDGDINLSLEKLQEWASGIENIFIMQNRSLIIDDVIFIGGTMWSDTAARGPIAQLQIQDGMNDFQIISDGGRKFRAASAADRFDDTILFIEDSLKAYRDIKKKVVVTHHAPSFRSIHRKYAGETLNFGYASDLEEMIETYEPNLWIHGHMHTSFDYKIGETRVICNPRGYVRYELNPDFNPNMVVEI